MEAFLEAKYQAQLAKFSPAYGRSSMWYVGESILPYLYNYLHLPTLFFSDSIIDHYIQQWLTEWEEERRRK